MCQHDAVAEAKPPTLCRGYFNDRETGSLAPPRRERRWVRRLATAAAVAATAATVGAAVCSSPSSSHHLGEGLQLQPAFAFPGIRGYQLRPTVVLSRPLRPAQLRRTSLEALRTLTSRMPDELLAEEEIEYEGLDDLELEEEEDEKFWEDKEEPETEVGEGIQRLETLWEEFQKTEEEPEFNDSDMERLQVAIRKDAPRCPSVSTVTWMTHVIDEMGLEDDDTFEMFEKIIVERADEMGAEDTLHAAMSFGNLYWVGPDKDHRLLTAVAGAVRRQLNDFTLLELSKISNALMRLGGTDDVKYAGLFFELNKRVYLPQAEDYIKDAVNRDSSVYQDESPEIKGLIDDFSKTLTGGRHELGPEVKRAIAYHHKQAERLAEEEELRQAAAPGLDEMMQDFQLIKQQQESSAADNVEQSVAAEGR